MESAQLIPGSCCGQAPWVRVSVDMAITIKTCMTSKRTSFIFTILDIYRQYTHFSGIMLDASLSPSHEPCRISMSHEWFEMVRICWSRTWGCTGAATRRETIQKLNLTHIYPYRHGNTWAILGPYMDHHYDIISMMDIDG